MILVVSPNLAVDRVLELDALRLGATNRADCLVQQAGGKGANVCRALRTLGGEGLLLGFAAGHVGELVARLAVDEGIELLVVVADGESRISTILLDGDGRHTDVFEEGPEIDAGLERALTEAIAQMPAGEGDWALVTGSAPPVASRGFYAGLVETLRGGGYRVMVDATDEQLRGALAAKPDFVKINLREAAGATGVSTPAPAACEGDLAPPAAPAVIYTLATRPPVDRPAPVLDAAPEYAEPPSPAVWAAECRSSAETCCRRLVELGAGAACVTLGALGSVALVDATVMVMAAPPVQTVNPVGSGDVYCAGLLVGFARGHSFAEAVPLAVGAAAANAATVGTACFAAAAARRLATAAALTTAPA
jgi:fructose-1-phosphate kinase PfkB-like protein